MDYVHACNDFRFYRDGMDAGEKRNYIVGNRTGIRSCAIRDFELVVLYIRLWFRAQGLYRFLRVARLAVCIHISENIPSTETGIKTSHCSRTRIFDVPQHPPFDDVPLGSMLEQTVVDLETLWKCNSQGFGGRRLQAKLSPAQ
jgi:hypothetical protein